MLHALLSHLHAWSGLALARLERRRAGRQATAAGADEAMSPNGDAAPSAPADDGEQAGDQAPPADGPPAHWLAMVRRHAPGLLRAPAVAPRAQPAPGMPATRAAIAADPAPRAADRATRPTAPGAQADPGRHARHASAPGTVATPERRAAHPGAAPPPAPGGRAPGHASMPSEAARRAPAAPGEPTPPSAAPLPRQAQDPASDTDRPAPTIATRRQPSAPTAATGDARRGAPDRDEAPTLAGAGGPASASRLAEASVATRQAAPLHHRASDPPGTMPAHAVRMDDAAPAQPRERQAAADGGHPAPEGSATRSAPSAPHRQPYATPARTSAAAPAPEPTGQRRASPPTWTDAALSFPRLDDEAQVAAPAPHGAATRPEPWLAGRPGALALAERVAPAADAPARDPWPDLPDPPDEPADGAADAYEHDHRLRRHHRRIGLEQRGAPWNA